MFPSPRFAGVGTRVLLVGIAAVAEYSLAEETIEPSDRKYSDQQVALIIRRAAELKEQSGGLSAGDGLSLESVREIAAEIGVESRFVDRAAALLVDQPPVQANSLLGGPLRVQLQDTYDRKLSEQELRDLLGIVRQVLHRQGEVQEALGSLEWKYESLDAIGVTVAPRSEGTAVQVVVDRTGAAATAFTLPIVAGTAVGGIIIASIEPGLGGIIGILLAGSAGGFAVGRTIWSAWTRVFRRRLDRLRQEIAIFIDR